MAVSREDVVKLYRMARTVAKVDRCATAAELYKEATYLETPISAPHVRKARMSAQKALQACRKRMGKRSR